MTASPTTFSVILALCIYNTREWTVTYLWINIRSK